MKKLPVDKGLIVFDIRWETDTAGPSPIDNKRVEVFLLGCDKANNGNPCIGCFNSPTWDRGKAEFSRDPIEIADKIAELTDLRYITIGGGEPTDQIDHLIPFVKRLKEHGFHIMMYTWRDILKENYPPTRKILDGPVPEYQHMPKSSLRMSALFKYVDIIVDGEFKQNECVYQGNLGDGMLSSIGSGNQRIFDIKYYRESNCGLLYYAMRDLVGLYIKPDTNDLVYITKE